MKLWSVVAILLVCSMLYGEQSKDVQKEELKKAMQSFASALELIQHGILYNKPWEMRKGAQLLDRSSKDFVERHGDALVYHMPDDPKFARSYAKYTALRIRDNIDKLSSSLGGPKDYSNTAAYYTHILNECVGCHQKIRQW
ncbi:hypothetical protein WCX49_09340 [Sulfurimonas sp. HSL-1656]|uniref:hypothetical protein n=1 Tax=Thiomicrolovo subterrani TaxID=3131934 RepID=UPI0031FA2975